MENNIETPPIDTKIDIFYWANVSSNIQRTFLKIFAKNVIQSHVCL